MGGQCYRAIRCFSYIKRDRRRGRSIGVVVYIGVVEVGGRESRGQGEQERDEGIRDQQRWTHC